MGCMYIHSTKSSVFPFIDGWIRRCIPSHSLHNTSRTQRSSRRNRGVQIAPDSRVELPAQPTCHLTDVRSLEPEHPTPAQAKHDGGWGMMVSGGLERPAAVTFGERRRREDRPLVRVVCSRWERVKVAAVVLQRARRHALQFGLKSRPTAY